MQNVIPRLSTVLLETLLLIILSYFSIKYIETYICIKHIWIGTVRTSRNLPYKHNENTGKKKKNQSQVFQKLNKVLQ